jgi:hypothetical protein
MRNDSHHHFPTTGITSPAESAIGHQENHASPDA